VKHLRSHHQFSGDFWSCHLIMVRSELVLEILVCSLFNHLMCMLDQRSFTGQYYIFYYIYQFTEISVSKHHSLITELQGYLSWYQQPQYDKQATFQDMLVTAEQFWNLKILIICVKKNGLWRKSFWVQSLTAGILNSVEVSEWIK